MPVRRLFPVIALLGAFAAPLGATAQTAPSPSTAATAAPLAGGHHKHHHHRSLIHALHAVNLTTAQQAQVAAFRDQARKANVGADRATKEANAAKMRQQIMGILTPGQKAQLATQLHPPQPNNAAPAPAQSPGSI